MYIALGVIAFFAVLLAVPVRLYVNTGSDSEIFIKVLFFKKKLNIAQKDIEEQAEISTESELKSKKKSGVKEKLLFYFELIKDIKKDALDIAKYISKRGVTVEKLNFYMQFGWDDAAQVGIAYGILNATLYGAMGFLHNHATVKTWNINILPDYEKEIFCIKLDSILKTRLVHIIVIGVKFAKLYVTKIK